MLHEFLALNRDEIIRRCRAKVAARSVPPPTKTEIDHGVPVFLDQLGDALRLGMTSTPEIGQSALLHGHDLLLQGFTVAQVVHDYGDVCQSITELAIEANAPIGTDDFRLLNACLDNAIAGALTQFGYERNQSIIDGHTSREQERLALFAHELRNLINTAMLAFEVVKSGNVGVAGSTGSVLHRNLVRARDLIASSLAEARVTRGIQDMQTLLVTDFIQELLPSATLTARASQVTLIVTPVEDDVAIAVDRQVLSSVILNLVQNAAKFTRPGTSVTLRARVATERVLIEIQDECGGLPGGDVDDLFTLFKQGGIDRTGLGLGLAFCRQAVDANNGRIYALDLPDSGCVFTVDLPRVQAPARFAHADLGVPARSQSLPPRADHRARPDPV